MSKKEQKITNKKFIEYNGKVIYYKTKPELVKQIAKLKMRLSQAKRLVDMMLKGKSKKFALNDAGELEILDLKKDFKGLLKTHFDIKRVAINKIVSNSTIKNTEFVDEIYDDDAVKMVIKIVMYVNWPSPTRLDESDITVKENPNKIDVDKLNEYIDERMIEVREDEVIYRGRKGAIGKFVDKYIETAKSQERFGMGIILSHKYYELTTFEKRVVKKSKYYVGDREYQLTEWANIEYLGAWERDGDSCAVKFISTKYPELYWEIKKLETIKGVSIGDFRSFCNKHGILYVFNTINSKVFDTNEKDDHFNDINKHQKHQALRAIVYDGHIYPYSGGKLKKIPVKAQKKIKINNANDKMISFMNDGIIPKNVKIGEKKNKETKKNELIIQSFVVKGSRYFENPQFRRCQEILEKFEIKRDIPININLIGIPDLILKIQKSKYNVSSFLPEKHNFKQKAIMWETSEEIDQERLIGIDKNKAYPHALMHLKYLIRHDWRKHKVIDIEEKQDHEINDEYLYSIKADYFTVMIPKSGLYPGYHIKKAITMGIQFTLLEELETETCYNFYAEIIEKLYNCLEEKEFKQLMVIIIGKMERNIEMKLNIEFDSMEKSVNDKFNDGFVNRIGDYTLRTKNTKTYKYVRDQIPINIQIKCFVYEELANKIIDLGINDNDIVQINTDSIFYYGEYPSDVKNKTDKELKKDLNGWKKCANFKSIKKAKETFKNDSDVYRTLTLKNKNTNTRFLFSKYAGNGKTHSIVNIIVPECIKNNKTYIVLTPTHSTLEEYKDKGINCEILQKFCFDETIPYVDIVIIDEIGFCGPECHDFIYKLNYYNRSFICFGDFNQLLPVGESLPYNQPHYIKYMFNRVFNVFANFRNLFTKNSYDKLIEGKTNLLKKVENYSSPIKTAQVAICFRKKTRRDTNEKIMKILKIQPYSVGCRMLCVTNKYLEDGLWNHKEITIKKIVKVTHDEDGEKLKKPRRNYIVVDSSGTEHIIDESIIKNENKFRFAYCINIYEAQGKTFESFHWVEDDNAWIGKMKICNRLVYTLISRLSNSKVKIKEVANFLTKNEPFKLEFRLDEDDYNY